MNVIRPRPHDTYQVWVIESSVWMSKGLISVRLLSELTKGRPLFFLSVNMLAPAYRYSWNSLKALPPLNRTPFPVNFSLTNGPLMKSCETCAPYRWRSGGRSSWRCGRGSWPHRCSCRSGPPWPARSLWWRWRHPVARSGRQAEGRWAGHPLSRRATRAGRPPAPSTWPARASLPGYPRGKPWAPAGAAL